MSQHITVRGFVATDPSIRNAQAGFPVGNFRLAATDRRFDREQNAWVDGTIDIIHTACVRRHRRVDLRQ